MFNKPYSWHTFTHCWHHGCLVPGAWKWIIKESYKLPAWTHLTQTAPAKTFFFSGGRIFFAAHVIRFCFWLFSGVFQKNYLVFPEIQPNYPLFTFRLRWAERLFLPCLCPMPTWTLPVYAISQKVRYTARQLKFYLFKWCFICGNELHIKTQFYIWLFGSVTKFL